MRKCEPRCRLDATEGPQDAPEGLRGQESKIPDDRLSV
jgi:hypothetical protein